MWRAESHLCFFIGLHRDLQLGLKWFAADCGADGMRISTSKSESVVLSWSRMEWPVQVSEGVEELKYRSVAVKRADPEGVDL